MLQSMLAWLFADKLIIFSLPQVVDSMHTGFACLLLQMHSVQCLMVDIGWVLCIVFMLYNLVVLYVIFLCFVVVNILLYWWMREVASLMSANRAAFLSHLAHYWWVKRTVLLYLSFLVNSMLRDACLVMHYCTFVVPWNGGIRSA